MHDRYYEEANSYYSRTDVQRSIVPYLKGKETCLMRKYGLEKIDYSFLRYKRVENENDFVWNILRAMRQFQKQFNIYCSVGTYKDGLPIISNAGIPSSEMQKRKQEWKQEHTQKTIGYDWLIDFDSPSYSKLKIVAQDVITVSEYLQKELGYNHRMIFTGCGFQITVPYTEMKNLHHFGFGNDDDFNIYEALQEKTRILHDTVSETVDMNVFDSLRIQKVPHCLVVNTEKSKEIFVTKIVTRQDLENFDLKKMMYHAKRP